MKLRNLFTVYVLNAHNVSHVDLVLNKRSYYEHERSGDAVFQRTYIYMFSRGSKNDHAKETYTMHLSERAMPLFPGARFRDWGECIWIPTSPGERKAGASGVGCDCILDQSTSANDIKDLVMYIPWHYVTPSFITELSKHFQTRNNGNQNSKSEFHFPRFVFVLRDFFLDDDIDGREFDADEYLEHAIAPKPGVTPEIRSFNIIRQCIRTNFEIRKCFTLGLPVMDRKRMKCLDQVRTDELCPEFREETGKFVEYIFNKSSALRVRGKCLNGSGKVHYFDLFRCEFT